MHRLMILAAAAMLAGSLATAADAQTIDKNGRCHAANGQFAKAEVCGGLSGAAVARKRTLPVIVAPAPEARPAVVTASRAKVPVRCKDDKGRFAKCGAVGAHPIG
jgi:hypothetical protein